MKKVLLVIAAGAVLASCQQSIEPQEQVELVEISSLSKESQLFVPLADIAAQYSTDDATRELVYKEIDKQFDGDNNVLFATMLKLESSVNGRSSKSEYILKIEAALESFKNIENVEPLYPQIYIPNYEELKIVAKVGVEQPIIVFRDGPPTEDGKYQGYAFENGKLLNKGMISEEFTTEHEVWVISINERVNEEEKIIIDSKTGKVAHVAPLVKFQGLTIHGKSNMKEDWVGGAAEVSLTMRKTYDGTYDPAVWGVFNNNENREALQDKITNVSRKDAKNNTYQNLLGSNIYFYNAWQVIGDPITPTTITYSLFEYDLWPASKHDLYIDNLWMVYRSYESPWITEKIPMSQMENYWKDTGAIGFILTE